MDNAEFEALSNLLINLNLAPQSMDIDQLEELISGELTIKEYANIFSKNDNNLYGDNNVLRNIFCKVEGHAVDHFFDTPFTHAVGWGVHLATLPIILFLFFIDILLVLYLPGYSTFPYYNTPLQNLILSIVDFGDTLKSLLNPYKKPERFVPVALPRLGDWFPVHQNPNLYTKGLFGEWVMQEYQGIDLMMVGFSGIWISYSDGYQYQACNFSGTSLYVKADGINYEP